MTKHFCVVPIFDRNSRFNDISSISINVVSEAKNGKLSKALSVGDLYYLQLKLAVI